MTDTTGKVVTLPKGIVVTDTGPWPQADGTVLHGVRRCVADDGHVTCVLDRVVAELPETHRRATLRPWAT